MASIKERNGKYSLIYGYKDKNGNRKQKWETFPTRAEALKRKTEVEYKSDRGMLTVPACATLADLLEEYVDLYGKERWALSTYERNIRLIRNYIIPMIGSVKLKDITPRVLEKFYLRLLDTPPANRADDPEPGQKPAGTSRIRDIHKLLKSCFEQAVKWQLLEKNPAACATVPRHTQAPRKTWDPETLARALETCGDPALRLALNLAFSCTLRIGELLGLTWDCVDISDEALKENRCFVYVNKEVQRVSKESMKALDEKDVILSFPERSSACRTVRVLKKTKTESSVRKVFLPETVARMLISWKKEQDTIKSILGDEYQDFGIVMAASTGLPLGGDYIRKKLKKYIGDADLDEVVFHSLRHSSISYKLKLNGGDIKAVQGDSGHAQSRMVTDVYSHIVDDDRVKTARMLEESFYGKKGNRQDLHGNALPDVRLPEGMDAGLLARALETPEMQALLAAFAKANSGASPNGHK